jgi:hypothetical protein
MYKLRILHNIIGLLLVFGSTMAANSLAGGILLSDMAETKKAMLQEEHKCSDDSVEVIEPWGPYGYSRYCRKSGLKHGRWVAWEKKRLCIEGYYFSDKQHGVWTWYHKDGRIYRIVEYKHGVEVSNKVINK